MPSLRVIGGPVFRVPHEGQIDIGRDGICDIVLVRRSVSRQHARITGTGEGHFVEDLDSNNGTFLNGDRVIKRTRIRDGDRINLYDVPLQFCEAEIDDASTDKTDDELHIGRSLDAERRLELVLDLGRRLCSTLSVEEILPRVLDMLFRVFPQSVNGEILLADEQGRLVPRATKQGREDDSSLVTIVPSVSELALRVFETGAPELATGIRDESSVLEAHDPDSSICAPLTGPALGPVGVAILEAEEDAPPYDGHDLELLAVICMAAGQAVENSRTHESVLQLERKRVQVEAARDVQRSILPRSRPCVPGYRFADHYKAADAIGGDHFDYPVLSENLIAVTIADVCGKGLSAALTMAQFSRDVRHALASAGSVKTAVRWLNQFVFDSSSMLVTFSLCLVDTTAHTLSVISAGHPLPLLRRGRSVSPAIPLERGGYPLGVDPSAEWRVTTRPIEPGDTFVLVTDGILEQFDDRQRPFGNPRLIEVVGGSSETVEGLVEDIVNDVDRYRGAMPQTDDRCVIAFQRAAENSVA